MQKISKKSCYYFYDREWGSWDQLRKNFKWEIPEKLNAAFYVCDVHSEDKTKVAILHEDYKGKSHLVNSPLSNAMHRIIIGIMTATKAAKKKFKKIKDSSFY